MVFAALFVVIYAVGIPVLFVYSVWRNLGQLLSPRVSLAVGFLYEGYSRANWWFEAIDMLHKLFITSLLTLFPPDWQLRMGLLVATLYLSALLYRAPLIRRRDDKMYLLVQAEVSLVFLAGMAVREDTGLDGKGDQGIEEGSAEDIALSIILLSLFAAVILFFIRNAIIFTRERVQRRKRARLLKQQQMFDDDVDEQAGDDDRNDSLAYKPGNISGDWGDEFQENPAAAMDAPADDGTTADGTNYAELPPQASEVELAPMDPEPVAAAAPAPAPADGGPPPPVASGPPPRLPGGNGPPPRVPAADGPPMDDGPPPPLPGMEAPSPIPDMDPPVPDMESPPPPTM